MHHPTSRILTVAIDLCSLVFRRPNWKAATEVTKDNEPAVDNQPISLADALTIEHHEIDAGIEAFVAGSSDDTPVSQWAAPLVEAMTALRRHIYLEEEIVFPRIRSGAMLMPVLVMLREHGEIWRLMDDLERQLSAAGADEEPGRSELVASCHRMLHLLEQHNQKEEPVIYPHVDADLDWVAQAHLRELLAEGTLPPGWVAEQAYM